MLIDLGVLLRPVVPPVQLHMNRARHLVDLVHQVHVGGIAPGLAGDLLCPTGFVVGDVVIGRAGAGIRPQQLVVLVQCFEEHLPSLDGRRCLADGSTLPVDQAGVQGGVPVEDPGAQVFRFGHDPPGLELEHLLQRPQVDQSVGCPRGDPVGVLRQNRRIVLAVDVHSAHRRGVVLSLAGKPFLQLLAGQREDDLLRVGRADLFQAGVIRRGIDAVAELPVAARADVDQRCGGNSLARPQEPAGRPRRADPPEPQLLLSVVPELGQFGEAQVLLVHGQAIVAEDVVPHLQPVVSLVLGLVGQDEPARGDLPAVGRPVGGIAESDGIGPVPADPVQVLGQPDLPLRLEDVRGGAALLVTAVVPADQGLGDLRGPNQWPLISGHALGHAVVIQRVLAEPGSQDGVRDTGEQGWFFGRSGDGARAPRDPLFFADQREVVTLADLRTGDLRVAGEIGRRIATAGTVGGRGGGDRRVNPVVFLADGDGFPVAGRQPVGLEALLDQPTAGDVVPDPGDVSRFHADHAGGPVILQPAAAAGDRVSRFLGHDHGRAQHQGHKPCPQRNDGRLSVVHVKISLTTRPWTSVRRNCRPWNL